MRYLTEGGRWRSPWSRIGRRRRSRGVAGGPRCAEFALAHRDGGVPGGAAKVTRPTPAPRPARFLRRRGWNGRLVGLLSSFASAGAAGPRKVANFRGIERLGQVDRFVLLERACLPAAPRASLEANLNTSLRVLALCFSGPIALAACGDDEETNTPPPSCDVAAQTGCAAGQVCEDVQGKTPACFAPLTVKGRVFDTVDAAEKGIANARVVARDANDAALSTVAVSAADGPYSLTGPAPSGPTRPATTPSPRRRGSPSRSSSPTRPAPRRSSSRRRPTSASSPSRTPRGSARSRARSPAT